MMVSRFFSVPFISVLLVSTPVMAAPELDFCPDRLHLRVELGALRSDNDTDDQEFSLIANTTIEGDFVRENETGSCVLLQPLAGDSIAAQIYVQFRPLSTGEMSVALEGYTPAHRKLYSVRTKVRPQNSVHGQHDSFVYNGSGPSRERLGQAMLFLSIFE